MLADVIEEYVAGFDDGPMDRYPAMPALAPTPIFAPPEVHATGTEIRGLRCERPVGQSSNGVNDFEDGARRIRPLSSSILQRMSRIGRQRTPLSGSYASG